MLVSHDQSERMEFCFCEIDLLVAPVEFRSKNLFNVDVVDDI